MRTSLPRLSWQLSARVFCEPSRCIRARCETGRAVVPRFYSSTTLLEQAHRALNNQDLPKAKALFSELVTKSTATIDEYYNLGVVEWLSKNPEAAVECWRQALRSSTDDDTVRSDCHTNLANYFLLFKPNLKEALKHLKSASELSPDDGEIRHNYGLALEKDDQIELALENYLRAEELGVQKDIDNLIRNAGAKLLKRNSELPPTKEEIEALKEVPEAMATQIDYGPSGNGR